MLTDPPDPNTACAPDRRFRRYRRKSITEMRPWVPGETLDPGVSVSAPDAEAGSPRAGDMIARNPANHADQWLVAEAYFRANFAADLAGRSPR